MRKGKTWNALKKKKEGGKKRKPRCARRETLVAKTLGMEHNARRRDGEQNVAQKC